MIPPQLRAAEESAAEESAGGRGNPLEPLYEAERRYPRLSASAVDRGWQALAAKAALPLSGAESAGPAAAPRPPGQVVALRSVSPAKGARWRALAGPARLRWLVAGAGASAVFAGLVLAGGEQTVLSPPSGRGLAPGAAAPSAPPDSAPASAPSSPPPAPASAAASSGKRALVPPSAPAAVRRRAYPRPTAPLATASPPSPALDTLSAERDLIAGARQALDDSRAQLALALARDHRARFPEGVLAEEGSYLEILALGQLGRAREAAALESAFHHRFPGSALLP